MKKHRGKAGNGLFDSSRKVPSLGNKKNFHFLFLTTLIKNVLKAVEQNMNTSHLNIV